MSLTDILAEPSWPLSPIGPINLLNQTPAWKFRFEPIAKANAQVAQDTPRELKPENALFRLAAANR